MERIDVKCENWIVNELHPLKLLDAAGLKEICESCHRNGKKNYSLDCYIKDISSNKIGNSISHSFNSLFKGIKTEISFLKNIGFSLTISFLKNYFLPETYMCIVLHYIQNGKLMEKFLALKTFDSRTFSFSIKSKVAAVLNDFGLQLNDNVIIVTEKNSDLIGQLNSNTDLFCFKDLLENVITKSVEEVNEIKKIVKQCYEIMYSMQQISSDFGEKFKRFSTQKSATNYQLIKLVHEYRDVIPKIIGNSNLSLNIDDSNNKIWNSILVILKEFDKAIDKLRDDGTRKIHLIFLYIELLIKKSTQVVDDGEVIIKFKSSLRKYLELIYSQDIKLIHKVALFLYPPTNQILNFSSTEQNLIKTECVRLMTLFLSDETPLDENSSNLETLDLSEGVELSKNLTTAPQFPSDNEKINEEIRNYETIKMPCNNELDPVEWWYLHKDTFPLLYKVSLKIFSAPTTVDSSDKIFAVAGKLLIDKKSPSDKTEQIVFLNINQSTKTKKLNYFPNSTSNPLIVNKFYFGLNGTS